MFNDKIRMDKHKMSDYGDNLLRLNKMINNKKYNMR